MNLEDRLALGPPRSMTIVRTGLRRVSLKAQEMRTEFFDIFDDDGTLVANCEIHRSQTNPPLITRRTTYKKYSAEGHQTLVTRDGLDSAAVYYRFA